MRISNLSPLLLLLLLLCPPTIPRILRPYPPLLLLPIILNPPSSIPFPKRGRRFNIALPFREGNLFLFFKKLLNVKKVYLTMKNLKILCLLIYHIVVHVRLNRVVRLLGFNKKWFRFTFNIQKIPTRYGFLFFNRRHDVFLHFQQLRRLWRVMLLLLFVIRQTVDTLFI